jgi:membrane protein YqaA with SNARE-associated domain
MSGGFSGSSKYWALFVHSFLSAILAKKQPKITYVAKLEVDAYIHWAEDPGVLCIVL